MQSSLQSTLQPTWISRKRTLGILIALAGILGAAAILILDALHKLGSSGIGPVQRFALLGCGTAVLFGVTLALFGVDPEGESLTLNPSPVCGRGTSESRPDSLPSPIPMGEGLGVRASKDSLVIRWPRRILIGLALALMVFHLFVFVVYAAAIAQFPFDYDQGEGFELNDTVLMSQGQSPYRSNEIYPFYASNYPPLYHIVLIPFVWLFGPQYWYGRLLGAAATLIAAGAIAYAVHRETRQRAIAVLAGLAFVASNYVYHIGPLFRQHIFMVMLETVAVVIIAGIDLRKLREGSPPSRRVLIIGLAFLLAAGYTKQLAIATVAAVFVYLFLYVPRKAIMWGAIFAAVAGAIFALFNVTTGGQWWLNIITANVNQYNFGQFRGLLGQFIALHGALLILAVLFALYEIYFDRISLYTIWFIMAAVDGILAGKWGAGDSYFTTMIAAMCILAGIFAGRCLSNVRPWRLPTLLPTLRRARKSQEAAETESESAERLRALAAETGLTPVPFVRLGEESTDRKRQAKNQSRKPGQSGTLRVAPIAGVLACALFVAYGIAVLHTPLDGPVFGPLAKALNLQARPDNKFSNFYDSAGWVLGYATIGQLPSAADVAAGWQIVGAIQRDPRPVLSEEAAFSFHTGKPVVTNPTQLLNLYQNGHYNPDALVKMIESQAFGAVIFRAGFYPEPVLAAVKNAYKGAIQVNMNGYQYTVLLPDPDWMATISGPRG